MRFLIIFLLLLSVAVVFVYPPLIEESDGECSALEQRIEDLASHDSAGFLIVGQLYGSSSSAPSGAAFAKDHYPLLPAEAGCVLGYWQTVLAPPAAATADAPPKASAPTSPVEVNGGGNELRPTLARDITPNGDPISPGTIFTSPMTAVAIRVEYPNRAAGALRFNLLHGRAFLSSCVAQKAAPATAWCKFNVELPKGTYAISLTANNALLGQFPFTVIGR